MRKPMALVHDGASMIAEEDKISNLPIDIIHHILSFLDMKYAIQTCKLSRKWKRICTSMPDAQSFRTMPQFANFVKHALSHRNSQTEVSTAHLTFTGKATQFVVKSILSYVYLHRVTQLNLTWLVSQDFEFPQCLFSSHTLKHLTLAPKKSYSRYSCPQVLLPKSDWDFPALETIKLSDILLTDDYFSKCVNLKDITLDQCSMPDLDIFNICAPQLSTLTITLPVVYPKVFNVVAPKLRNLTAPVIDGNYYGYSVLQLSTDRLDSLDTVKLWLLACTYRIPTDIGSKLLNLFQKLCNAKFLVLDFNIIQILSSSPDQLLHEPCPFDKLKSVKIDKVWFDVKEFMETMPIFESYLLESSPSATFRMDLPQAPQKRRRLHVDEELMSKKIARLEEENQQLMIIGEEKRNLEAKMHMQDQVISQQQKMLEATKLQYQKLMSNIINSKMAELQVLVEGGNPNYALICSMGRDIKSIIDSAPDGLREAFKAEISSRFEEVKSLRFSRLGACQWAMIEKELGCYLQS